MIVSYSRIITDKVKYRLYALSGNRCALCDSPIFENSCNTGEICHIQAISENGPRYNPNLTNEIVNSYENLILLCPRCHKRIDDESNLNIFTVDYLKKYKNDHEKRVVQNLLPKSIGNRDFLFSDIISDQLKNELRVYSKEEIQISLKRILQGNPVEKYIIWEIVCSCCNSGENYQINLSYLHNIFESDFNRFVYEMIKLRDLGYVCETKYSNNIVDGEYDDKTGDFLPDWWNYDKQAAQGEWYLDRLGQILLIVRRYLNYDSSFYLLIFNEDAYVLK